MNNKKIIAFGASNSQNSINKKLASFAAHQIEGADIAILDLNDYEMPIYSIDRERENGIPSKALNLKSQIKESNGLIISFAEHNGGYTAAFKNVMDWLSRIEGSTWENKPMFLLATSPGGRGAKTVLELVSNTFKYMNKNSIVSYSLPSFHKNFSEESGIIQGPLANEFRQQLQRFDKAWRGFRNN